MEFDAVDWDHEDDGRGNTRHIAANGVSQDEFEEALDSVQKNDVVSSHTSGRPTVVGETRDGRRLRIVFEIEVLDDFTVIRPITAYDDSE